MYYSIHSNKTAMSAIDIFEEIKKDNEEDNQEAESVISSKEITYDNYSRIFITSICSDLAEELFQGYNHLCLFYGQTGSGKSYNMFGENNFNLEKSVSTTDKLDNPNDTRGIMVRVIKRLFNKIDEIWEGDKDKEENYRVTLNYYDVHLDKVRDIGRYVNDMLQKTENYDLQSMSTDKIEKQYVNVQEKPNGHVVLKGVTTIQLANSKDAAFIADKGRSVQDLLNLKLSTTSTVSHTIISVNFRNDEKGVTSKLYFVELAGSEWYSTNAVESQRIQESIIINNSFNTLAKVVNLIRTKKEVEESKSSQVQVSYHDSKLTRVLQNVLNKDYKLSIFGSLYPTDLNLNESIKTLRFLDKIRGVSSTSSQKWMFSPRQLNDDDEEQSKHQAILNNLTMENLELKGYIENQKKVFGDKLDKVQEILGLEIPIERILESKPNTKEYNNIKKFRETRERAETLSLENHDLENRLNRTQNDLDDEK